MVRPLAIVAMAATLFAGVNLVASAHRTMSGEEAAPAARTIAAQTSAAIPAPPPATVVVPPIPATSAATPTTQAPGPAPDTPTPTEAPAAPSAPVDSPPPLLDALTARPSRETPPGFATAAFITRGIGCAAEPFAAGFAQSGLTPAEIDVGSCEIVLDIPGRVPTEQVCAQVSGPPVARSIHVAQRTIDGDCRRDPEGVVIHEIGHAWHLADPTRYYRVLATFGLDPTADASLEVVAECFVEAVGYLDTACSPQGTAYIRAEMEASRVSR